MRFDFAPVEPPPWVDAKDWQDWKWHFKHALKKRSDFERYFELQPEEVQGLEGLNDIFQVRVSPYYAHLASPTVADEPIRKILMPHGLEKVDGLQQMLDPLGEKSNNPSPRVIHRYPDRCLLLVTDFCSVYCRYCTRKHFTGQDQAFIKRNELDQAIEYIEKHPGIREVILSGGDPLTLADSQLLLVMQKLRKIPHVEIIRIGTRIPVVVPMRVTPQLLKTLKDFHPIFIMTHFNHPKEITREAAEAITMMVDHGFPVMNQMVLLNGVNNHPALVQALSRRLLYLRAKPYYMFQCDPSEGSDHLRTSVENSLAIQKELWGRLSGLAMPNLSLDIPHGGGKTGLTPDFQTHQEGHVRHFTGWDGVSSSYVSPPESEMKIPVEIEPYVAEWNEIKNSDYGGAGAP